MRGPRVRLLGTKPMPELPEVQTVVSELCEAGLPGRRILMAVVNWPATVASPDAGSFCRGVRGAVVRRIRRRGKFIVIELSASMFLLVHLRMSGRMRLAAAGEVGVTRHDHVLLFLDDGRVLTFRDTRKFGRWILTRHPEEWLRRLGPEPLSNATAAPVFHRRLRTRRRMLKPLLLDQAFLAGLGNIYVDEALWRARLHPMRRAHTLDGTESAALGRAIRQVLREAVAAAGTTLGKGETNFYSVSGKAGRHRRGLRVFRRHGEPCPRCGETIVRLRVAQRGTHVCPRCQTLAAKDAVG